MALTVDARVPTAAADLAEFCATLRWDNLSATVRDRTRELTLDLLGVAIRGSAESSSAPAVAMVRATQPSGKASIFGGRLSTSAAWAALANGTAAHAIEMDDVARESSLHPGVPVIPAAFALAEERGATPTEFFEAVVAGYEVVMRVGNALNPASAYARGFHPTGVAGVFGAAMAAGRILGLDPKSLTHALGIAGTMASGSLEYLGDGSWTKRLNAGWAAHAGIVAAQMAYHGFTGPSTVFDGRLGLLHGYTDDPLPQRLTADFGDPLQIMRVTIKPYACCRYNHGLIDCIIELRQTYGIRPEEVDEIRLGVLSGGALLVAEPIDQKQKPRNVVDAQFSAPFASAVALVHGAGGLEVHAQEVVDDPTIRSLMARTTCYRDASLDDGYPAVWPAEASIRLVDGRTVSTRVEYATGEPENPVPRNGLVAKFVSLTQDAFAGAGAEVLAARILRLDEEPDLQGVADILRGDA